MTDKVITRPSTKKYRKGWEEVFGGRKESIWKCPKCGKEIDYGKGRPIGESYCSETGRIVRMVKIKGKR